MHDRLGTVSARSRPLFKLVLARYQERLLARRGAACNPVTLQNQVWGPKWPYPVGEAATIRHAHVRAGGGSRAETNFGEPTWGSRHEFHMARPKQIARRAPLTPAEINAAAYVGSKEHKVVRWWGGLPGARVGRNGRVMKRPKKQLTTICPLVTEAACIEATGWVQQALAQKQCRFYEGDQTYPKHIWHQDGNGQYWFGFCMNGTSGTYKGWPIDEAEKREKFD